MGIINHYVKVCCVHFAYRRIANYWANLVDFWTRMIAVTLPFFSYLFRGSLGSKLKVDYISISKVWTTGMLVVMEGPPDKRTGAPTSSNWQLVQAFCPKYWTSPAHFVTQQVLYPFCVLSSRKKVLRNPVGGKV